MSNEIAMGPTFAYFRKRRCVAVVDSKKARTNHIKDGTAIG